MCSANALCWSIKGVHITWEQLGRHTSVVKCCNHCELQICLLLLAGWFGVLTYIWKYSTNMYGIISHGKMAWIYMLRLVSTYLFSLLWTCEVIIVLHYIIHSISFCWNLASGWSTVACSSIRVTRGAVFISNVKEMALHGTFFFTGLC